MIKIENTAVYGWEAAIRGMRNPMNSWDKSDSGTCSKFHFDLFGIGSNDYDLMMKLACAGPVHAKYRRMINVTCDITAPLYWWSEYDTYKVGTVANSCSKMHKLLYKPFEMNDFSFDKLSGYKNEIKQFRPIIDEETELWKKIDADYDVSNQGRVRHGKRVLSGSLHLDGYIFVTLHGKQIPVHRLVAKAFVSDQQRNKPEVNHKDGNKQNNFADNLEWVTRSENLIHAVKNNLQPKGYSKYNGKFTNEERAKIKTLWDHGDVSKRELAKKYGVSHTCINDIINDKYRYAEKVNLFEEVARPIVDILNELRDSYFECTNETDKKTIWYAILQLLPSSYNQKRTIQMNYEVLVGMYRDRKNHKLDEWHTLCDWIRELPYSEIITLEDAVAERSGEKGGEVE